MIAKEYLKAKLLATDLFIDNSYLEDYLTLVYSYDNSLSIGYSEVHHVIPVSYYKKLYKCKTRTEALVFADADTDNFTCKLLYKDHCKAHWLLYYCSKSYIRAGSVACLTFMKNVCKGIKDIKNISDADFEQIQSYIDNIINNNVTRYWSISDIQFLYKNYPEHGQRYCATALKKSIQAVGAKAISLGLTMNKWWSDVDKQFLIDNSKTLTINELATTLNRTEKAIISKLSELNLTPADLYTEDEIQFLRSNYSIYGPSYCAKILNRTSAAIKRKANYLGLACSQGDPIYCPELNKTFVSISAAAKELNLSDGNICQVVHGKAKTTRGYSFIKLDRKEYYEKRTY